MPSWVGLAHHLGKIKTVLSERKIIKTVKDASRVESERSPRTALTC